MLWISSFKMAAGVSSTDPTEGFKTKEECTRAAEFGEKREDARRKKDPSVERYFSCLPDTVDPRGTKGK